MSSSSGILISDVISKTRDIMIFAGLTRDVKTISQRLEDSSSNATVLAPINSVMNNLPQKPWEDPKDYGFVGSNAYEGRDGENRARKNLQRFAEAHIVPESPWKEGSKVNSLGGTELWYETKDGKKFIHPGGIEVVEVTEVAANGEAWLLNGILNH